MDVYSAKPRVPRTKTYSWIATLAFFVVATILLKAFGATVAFSFMIVAVLLVTALSVILREKTKQKMRRYRDDVQQWLGGRKMYDVLLNDAKRLYEAQRWDKATQDWLLDALDPEDAHKVRQLLNQGPKP